MTAVAHIEEDVVRAVEPVLLGFAFRAVRQTDLARDLVQQTYVAALEAHATFEGRSSLRTWMVGILSRKIVDHYRRTRREVLMDIAEDPDPLSTFAPAPTQEPEKRLDRNRAMQVVERGLGELKELERLAVLMCDVEHVGRPEVCNALGIRPTHLRVLLHRGRHKLRKTLEDAELRPDGW